VRGNTKVALAETGPEPPPEMPDGSPVRNEDTTADSV